MSSGTLECLFYMLQFVNLTPRRVLVVMIQNIELLYISYITLGVTVTASVVALISALYIYYFMEMNAIRRIQALLSPLETLDLQLAERALPDGFIERLATLINVKVDDIKKEKDDASKKWRGEIPLEYDFALIVPKDEGKIHKPSNIFLMAESNDPNYQTFANLPPDTFTASKAPYKSIPSKPTANKPSPSTDPMGDPRVPMARIGDPNYQTLAYVPNTFEDKKPSQSPKTPALPTVTLEAEDAYENLQESD